MATSLLRKTFIILHIFALYTQNTTASKENELNVTTSPTTASISPTPFGTPMESSAQIPYSWYGSTMSAPTVTPFPAPSSAPTLKDDLQPTLSEVPVTETPPVAPTAPTPIQVQIPWWDQRPAPTPQPEDGSLPKGGRPTPSPTNVMSERTINLGTEIWSAAYAVQIFLLCVGWRFWAWSRSKSTPPVEHEREDLNNPYSFHKVGDEQITYQALRIEFARSRDNMQYIAFFGFLTSLFFWSWALYNVLALNVIDTGVVTCFLAMICHLIGLASVGRRLVDHLPPGNIRNAYCYKATVLWVHLLVVCSFALSAYTSTSIPHSHNWFSHCIIMAVLWLFAGILTRRSAGKWCETIEIDSMVESRNGKRKIVNGVLSAPEKQKDKKEKKKTDKTQAKSSTKPFSGSGKSLGGSSIPPTRVMRRSDFTELSPESTVTSDSIFKYVQRNNAFDDDDAAAGLEMGFRHMRDDMNLAEESDEDLDSDEEDLDAAPLKGRR